MALADYAGKPREEYDGKIDKEEMFSGI